MLLLLLYSVLFTLFFTLFTQVLQSRPSAQYSGDDLHIHAHLARDVPNRPCLLQQAPARLSLRG
jgi:hypothetical protein